VLFLHRWFSRAAATTIVTNEAMAATLEGWGASATLVRDVPVCFAEPVAAALPPGCNMTFVCTFTRDEPIELFFRAAALVPDVHFHVTGNYKRADPAVLAAKPANVRLTGFLGDGEYVGLLLASDAVISLTTLDHTMQRAAYEAVYLGRPVVTSDFDLLRRHFCKGAVHVRNSVDDIAGGIGRMRDALARMRAEVDELRREHLEAWGRAEHVLRGVAAGAKAAR
jgi:glycosyltransferase involved in cell wall biosynthesis